MISLLLFIVFVNAGKYYTIEENESINYVPINICTYFNGSYYEYLFNEQALVLSIGKYDDEQCSVQIENKHETITLNQITEVFNNSLKYIHIPSKQCNSGFELKTLESYSVTVYRNHCVSNKTEGVIVNTLLIDNINTYVGFNYISSNENTCNEYKNYDIISKVGCDGVNNRYYFNTTICEEGEMFNGESCICNSYDGYSYDEEEGVCVKEEELSNKLKASELVPALLVLIVSALVFSGMVVYSAIKKILQKKQ